MLLEKKLLEFKEEVRAYIIFQENSNKYSYSIDILKDLTDIGSNKLSLFFRNSNYRLHGAKKVLHLELLLTELMEML